MIDAYRRGSQIANEEIHKHQPDLPMKEIKSVGESVFTEMKQKGYAHIEPKEEFIQGFTQQFQQLQYITKYTTTMTKPTIQASL